jgi:tetratricopeptide (TPR) repeat protein
MGPLDSPELLPDRGHRSLTAAAGGIEPSPGGEGPAEAMSGAAVDAADTSASYPGGLSATDGPPFGLTSHDTHGVLSLRTWPLAPLAQLDTLVVSFPMGGQGAAGGAELGTPEPGALADRYRNRRGRLLQATMTTDLGRVAHEIDRSGIRARLAAAGISDVRIGITDGSFRLVGRAAAGEREAAFTARARVDQQGARRIRISVDDLRIYGFLPIPAPLVARAILTSVVHARPGPRWWIDLDPLEIALLETFAGHGWRMPDAGDARLETVQITSERIAFDWTTRSPDDAAGPDASAETPAPDRGLPGLLDEADGLLARGDHEGALDAYRRALKDRPGDPNAALATNRVLEILASSAGHLAEADDLAAEILARQPEEPLPLLVRAVAAAERGDLALAADGYEQIAAVARRRNEEEDVIIARLSAAEQWLRADKTERAHRLAEQVLATLPAHANGETERVLQSLGDRLVSKGDLGAADRVFESRLALATDAAARGALTIERARTRLLGTGGARKALAVLAQLPVETAPNEALLLRAELGERQSSPDDAVPALDELAARARHAGGQDAARAFEERSVALLERVRLAQAELNPDDQETEPATARATAVGTGSVGVPTPAIGTGSGDVRTPPPTSPPVPGMTADDLEHRLTSDPTDAAAAESLAAIYWQIPEPNQRADALSGLLRRASGLSPDRRKAIYASLGASAEASGDLDRAEQAYWRAATIEAEPASRASFLVSHARVLLARGETETAISELEEALARVPDHAGALALLGDLAFRRQDWARARSIYASLAASPGTAEVISRERLIYRRAQIAQSIGQEGEAENHLREVAILNPRHVEARESLANIALGRGDFGGAALRLEEVLRLLPFDALDRLLEVRQRLGGVYLQLQDWSSARYYIELVLSQDPTRTAALEVLVNVYLRLGDYREAADACGRLARIDANPRQRAEILYRQAEILRVNLGDESQAMDAYLRSSDLDPQFTPSLLRLADAHWRHGAFDDLAELAVDLAVVDFISHTETDNDTLDLPLRLAVATRLAPVPGDPAAPVPPASHATGDLPRRARVLSEAAGFFGARSPRDLDPALEVLLDGSVTSDEGGRGTANGLYRALADLVQVDPADNNMGAVRALGRVAECLGLTAAARGMYSVLVFVDPQDAATAALEWLGPAGRMDAWQKKREGRVMALLADKQPIDALEAMASQDPLSADGARVGPERRRELLRTLPARELIGAMLSSAYQLALD